MPKSNEENKEEEKIPEVELKEIPIEEIKEEKPIIPIEMVSQLIMFQTGTATVAPTHKPRNFYEQIVWKDDGTNKYLWIWSQYDSNWRYISFT